MKNVDVTTEITISCPIHKVAAYSADPDNAPEWYVNIKSIEWLSDKPLAVGSRLAFKARFLGRELSYTYEVMEYIPSERLVMKTADGPFPMQTTYTWKETGEGETLMTLRNTGSPAGFSKFVAPFMAGAMSKANQKDLALLKRILETQSVS